MSERKVSDAYCTYGSVKIDVEVLHQAKIAALMGYKTIQEWLSDLVNDAAAKQIGSKPLKRKPPKPRTGRKPTAE